MILDKLLNIFRPEIGVVRGQFGQAVLSKTDPIHSTPQGVFSVYFGDDVESFFFEHGNLSRTELTGIPQLVYEGCKTLGVLRPERVHFMVKIHDSRKPDESSMTVSKIMPAIVAPNGNPVARSLIVFKPPFLWDMHASEEVVKGLVAAQTEQLNPFAQEHIAQGLRRKRKTKCGTLLVHEMIHIFVTDEYRKCFKGWDLATLELFTDAITVAILFDRISDSLDEFAASGFIEAAAYLSNQLRTEMGTDDVRPLLEAMGKRAKKVIESCKNKPGVSSVPTETRV